MIKGEIWWAALPSPRGSEPGKTRPVLIIQSDNFNRSTLNTVICAVITSNTNLSAAPANILMSKSVSGLDKPSVINFSQIITVDKSYFIELVSMLPKSAIIQIDKSIKIVFDLN